MKEKTHGRDKVSTPGSNQGTVKYMKEKRLNLAHFFREIQVKTTMRSFLTSVKMAIIKKSTNNKCWKGCGKNPLALLMGM